jgi:hypothetical protein
MPKDGVRRFTLAWDQLLVDQVDTHAELAGLSRSEWLQRAAEYVRDHRIKLIERPRDVAMVGCPHPRAERIQLTYGSICGICKILVR